MERKEIEIDRRDGWKYQGSLDSSDSYRAEVWVNDDGSIDEERTYSRQYKEQLAKSREESKPKETTKRESRNSNISSSSSSSSSNDEEEGSCVKFLCTIIPILPIWWIIKLFLKAGVSTLTLLWWLVKSVFYIVTWPIRVFMCCCLDKEERRFLPKLELDIWPAYSFKKF